MIRGFNSWVGKIPWRRAWQPTPVFLSGEPNGQRSLVGYSPWGRKELDVTEVTEHTHIGLLLGGSDCRLEGIETPRCLSVVSRPGGSWAQLEEQSWLRERVLKIERNNFLFPNSHFIIQQMVCLRQLRFNTVLSLTDRLKKKVCWAPIWESGMDCVPSTFQLFFEAKGKFWHWPSLHGYC